MASRIDEQQYIFGFHTVKRSRSPRSERIAEIVGGLPETVLHGHVQVVLRGNALVFVVKRAGKLRPKHGDVEFVVAQRRVGVVQHLIGKHREIVEHLLRRRGPVHQRIHRRRISRPVGNQRDIAGVGFDHLHGVGKGDEKRIGEIEAVPVVPAEVVALLFRGEARGGDGRKEDPRAGRGGLGLLRGGVPAAAARGDTQGRQQEDQDALHKYRI